MSIKTLDLGSDSSTYLKLAEGTTKIRLISEAVPVWTEFNKEEKTAKKYLDESLAKQHPEAKRRYAFWCIDRKDGKIKMAELGISVMKQIQTLSLDSDYGFEGDIMPYDIKILKEGSGMDTSYTVTPSPATDITEDEKQKILGLEKPFDFFKKQPGVVTDIIPF